MFRLQETTNRLLQAAGKVCQSILVPKVAGVRVGSCNRLWQVDGCQASTNLLAICMSCPGIWCKLTDGTLVILTCNESEHTCPVAAALVCSVV